MVQIWVQIALCTQSRSFKSFTQAKLQKLPTLGDMNRALGILYSLAEPPIGNRSIAAVRLQPVSKFLHLDFLRFLTSRQS